MGMEISNVQTVLELILEEILARLPLRNIARFKSVCKTWKSVIESPYFRRLFLSLHRDSSSSWSLMFPTDYRICIKEPIGFHGCETWDLPKTIHSYVLDFQRSLNLPDDDSRCYYVTSSNGLIWIQIFVSYTRKSFVGNPVLQEWVEIPPPPEQCFATGLVTRVDDDGVVSSFKVVWTFYGGDRNVWRVYVYSSVTRKYTLKRLVSSHPVNDAGVYTQVNLNGMLYMWEKKPFSTEPGVVIAHDFYGPEEADDQCRVIHLPEVPVTVLNNNQEVRRCLTTSGGHVFLVEVLYQRLKLWKLNNNNRNSDHDDTSEVWQLLKEEINMESFRFGFDIYPVAMNPFDSDIVYLWNQQHNRLVSGSLRTKELVVLREPEHCSSKGCYCVNTNLFGLTVRMNMEDRMVWVVSLSQFVLPRWMDSVPPRPPN